MKDKIVLAIIGCGTIANNQHLPQTSSNPKAKIKYAIDIIEDKAKKACKDYNIEKYHTDYHVAINDTEVDAVIVCTPNYVHYEITMEALKAGKHVFCEKPVTVNYALSLEMANQAKKYGKILDIGVVNRCNKSIQIIKEYIDNGVLGEVYHTNISFRSFRSIPGLGGDFTTKAIAGGGVLIDWGVHFIDLALYALGLPKVKTVSATAYCKLGVDKANYVFNNMWAGPPKLDGTYDVDDYVTGFIRTTGSSISFDGAWAQNINKDEMYVDFIGDKAGVRLDYGGTFTMYGAKDGVLQTTSPNYNISNAYYIEVDKFIDSINSSNKSEINIDDVLETMKILEAIYKSSEQNKEISL